MPKSTNTVSTERSSVCTRLQLISSSSSSFRSLMMTPNKARPSKLSRTLSHTFSLRRFHGKPTDNSASVPKEIKIDIPMIDDGRETTDSYTPKEVNVHVLKETIANKRAQERRKEEENKQRELCRKSPVNDKTRLKDTTQLYCGVTPPPSAKKEMVIPSLMSPCSKKVAFRGVCPIHEHGESSSSANDKAWKLEKPPVLLSRASPPQRTVTRYASSNHILSIHATPVRPKMHRQTSVYIPKADLDKLCNMYDDIVDTPFRAH